MAPDALTRRVTRTETLGPGLVPSPLSVSTTAIPPEKRKRTLEDDEEETESRKRHCPSPEICVYCGRPAEERPNSKDKENSSPSGARGLAGPASTPSTSTPLPSPAQTVGHPPPTLTPAVGSPPLCKAATRKPVLAREVRKPVLRPQPFRRLPTAVNQARVDMRNNLRDIFLGRKAQPTGVGWARDVGPRRPPHLRRGTGASNPTRRGELSQPVPECTGIKYSLSPPIANSTGGLTWFPHPSLFLGSGEREWVRDVENPGPVPPPIDKERPCLVGEALPDLVPFTIRHRVSGEGVLVYPGFAGRSRWRESAQALWDRLRRRAARHRKAGKAKPVSRWRGPDGKLKAVQKFPIVPSTLRIELAREDLEGGDGEDTEVDDAPEADRTDVEED